MGDVILIGFGMVCFGMIFGALLCFMFLTSSRLIADLIQSGYYVCKGEYTVYPYWNGNKTVYAVAGPGLWETFETAAMAVDYFENISEGYKNGEEKDGDYSCGIVAAR